MNSMMLIPGPVYPRSTPALDAFTAARAHHRGVPGARRQHHPVARSQVDLAALVLEALLDHSGELVPREAGFERAEGNSDSHIKALLVGPSATVPVSGGEVRLGQWQAIFMCEFDGPRERSLWVSVNGEGIR